MRFSLLALVALVCGLARPGLAQTRTRCILHTDSASARVDSCTTTKPAPPPPPPAPAPAPAPAPPPPVMACGRTDAPRVVTVSTAAALHTALANAQPGDAIVMAPGTYTGAGEMRVATSGTAAHPISVCGPATAIIDAGSRTGTSGISATNANYWHFIGFTITNALFGIYATHSSNAVIRGLTLHAIGQEAISLKLDSKHDTVAANTIYDTGLSVAEYGEGVYVGTANAQWVNGVPDHSDSTVIIGNAFGPNVRAEAVDVKEATHGTLVRHNTFDGTGEVESQGTGESGWPNSPVILQGMDARVDSNTVTHPLVAAFRVVTHGTVETGANNVFAANTVDAGGALYGFLIQTNGTGNNVVKCSNVVTNAQKYASVACSQ